MLRIQKEDGKYKSALGWITPVEIWYNWTRGYVWLIDDNQVSFLFIRQ